MKMKNKLKFFIAKKISFRKSMEYVLGKVLWKNFTSKYFIFVTNWLFINSCS